MTCDMVALCTGGSTVLPFTSETEVISALSTDVVVAEMAVKDLGIGESGRAIEPLACVGLGVREGGVWSRRM